MDFEGVVYLIVRTNSPPNVAYCNLWAFIYLQILQIKSQQNSHYLNQDASNSFFI
jgi:hypothetical protein